ncbi:translocation/assembly module TamB domain-containing protein [Desulfovibrio desulfuricans]|uniref:translocation/assembly module TamB domain-containing protein n=1 Tax=Desulfovibrio desulfuricans TaxID=876 RepID=UPI0035B0E4AE
MDTRRDAAQPPSSARATAGADGAAPSRAGQPAPPDRGNKRGKGWLRLAGRVLGLCALLCALALAGALAALRSEGVQAWLVGKINAVMQAAPGAGAPPQGIQARITHLSGPLPFGFALGVELYDAQGLWLRLPACSAHWDWQALPSALQLSVVRIDNAQLLRLPLLPDAPPPEPASPLTEASLRAGLGAALRGLASLPDWLPTVRIENFAVANALLPQTLLGQSPPPPEAAGSPAAAPPVARLDAGLKAAAGTDGAQADLNISLKGADTTPLLLAGQTASAVEVSVRASAVPSRQGDELALDMAAELACELRTAPRAHAPDVPETAATLPAGDSKTVEAPLLATLLGQGAQAEIRLTARVTAPPVRGQALSARAAVENISLQAGLLRLAGHAGWTGGAADSWLAGPLDVDILASLGQDAADHGAATPEGSAAPADAGRMPENVQLPAKAQLRTTLNGPLQAPDVLVSFDCPAWSVGGHSLADASLRLQSTPFNWRQVLSGGAAQPLQPLNAPAELAVSVQAVATVDKFSQSLGATLFARQVQDNGRSAVQAGLRDLQCAVLGIAGGGQLTATLPLPLAPTAMPRVDGKVDVRVTDWKALAVMLPGARLDGDAALSLELRSQPAQQDPAPQKTSSPSSLPAYRQQAALRWRIPRMLYREDGSPAVEIHGLEGEAVLTDVFGAGELAGRLDLAMLRSGDKKLGAKVRAQGSIWGPLEANFETSGFAAARCTVRWQPGTLELRRLELDLPAQKLGLRAASAATVRYGAGELGLSGLDVVVKPSGRLRAQAVITPDRLDARFALEQLSLAPWRVLVPSLPAGAVEASARLTGSPSRPQGDLRLEVRNMVLPGAALKPMNVTVTGKLEHDDAGGGALTLRLVPDPATVAALGGTECRVEARVPLLFDASGLPRPHMQGPLRAAVRWNGAAAPLWSLLPVADQRLAGRLAVSLDVGGTLESPAPKGLARLDEGRYENLLLGVLLTGINLRLDLDGGRNGSPGLARLNLAAADGQGGTARITGQARIDGSHLDFVADVNHLRPLRRRDVRVELSAHAAVGGSAAAPQVRGTLTVNQGLVLLNNLDVASSITTLPISEAPPAWARGAAAAPPATASTAPGGTKKTAAAVMAQADQPAQEASAMGGKPGLLDVRVVMPGRFLVEGFGLKSEWRADMHVGGTPAEPLVSGQLSAVKGSLDILGKNFKLARGAVTFGGGAVSNPLLDIMLTSQTPALAANISIVGTVRKMQLILSSDPEMPRDEILAQILFGKSASELGRLENLRLAAAVAQLAGFGTGNGGGGVLDSARQALGVDVLRFNSTASGAGQQGQGGENMAAGSAVEMGKYLTEDIYVGVQQGAKQGSTAFVIQLELTPRANLEVRTEQQSTKGGLTWKYSY